MKFYKRDPDRALAGMAELTLKQRGAYNSIIDLLYSRDGDVPDDDARVSRMIACHWREWVAVKKDLIALGKIWVEGGKLHAKRVQETIKDASRFSQEQSMRASRGWQARKNVNENNDPLMPPGNASTATATARLSKKEKRDSKESPKKFPRDALISILGDELASAVIEHRQRISKPLTFRAAEMLARQFEKYHDPPAGAEAMLARGWQGFKAEWMDSDQRRGRGKDNGRDEYLRQVARRLDERASPNSGVDNDPGQGDAVKLLPSRNVR